MTARLIAVLASLVACGDERAQIRLAPISPCGQVETETALRVVAYTSTGEQRRTVQPNAGPAVIDAFPADTEQLGVEVIGDSGRIVAVGKSAPLTFASLADGAEIPIMMAPIEGFCPVGPMTEPRRAPAVARAGDMVLVVGGTGVGGEPLGTAELFDPATATFSAVTVPATLVDPESGLAGAVLTELADGRVALSGTAGHALSYFEPATRRFTTPTLFDRRAFHGALGLADERLLVIGGCADVSGGACAGASLTSGFVYELDDIASRVPAPELPSGTTRHGARVLPLGVQSDGTARFLLAGGTADATSGDRFALADAQTERITGLAAQLAPLDGGAILTAFAADGQVASGAVAVLPPDRSQVVATTLAPPLDAPRLVALEDGSLLAIGDRVARFDPTGDDWTVESPGGVPPGPLTGAAPIRLADGSVLVVGGTGGADAWLYRPSLVGASSGSVIVVPDNPQGAVLTAPDPSTVDRSGGRFVLVSAADDLHARALVGGPRMTDGSVSAIVRVMSGGVALIARQTAPGQALVGRIVPGEQARIVQIAAGTTTVLCSGATVTEADLAVPITLLINDGVVTLSSGAPGASTVKATCDAPASDRGAWGLAAAGAGARIEVGPVTVSRSR